MPGINSKITRQLSDFNYDLPKELIAQDALSKRPDARLMAANRFTQQIEHRQFRDIEDYFEAGDVLVLNNTKVLPARLFAKKKTGGKVEILLIDPSLRGSTPKEAEAISNSRLLRRPAFGGTPRNDVQPIIQCLLKPSGRVKKDEELILSNSAVTLNVLDEADHQTGIRHIQFSGHEHPETILERYGRIPLPPYIDREDSELDRELYQTVFARVPGAVASPTAGLHFDEPLLEKIKSKGVEILFVTLHVGYGTFQPVASEDLANHKMHEEQFEISQETAARINLAKSEGRKITACGTTVVRALESSAVPGTGSAGYQSTDIFIYPPYTFKIADRLITNFHLPKTTLLMLASAFSGHDFLMRCYREAIAEHYRFFSYGDAMLIL